MPCCDHRTVTRPDGPTAAGCIAAVLRYRIQDVQRAAHELACLIAVQACIMLPRMLLIALLPVMPGIVATANAQGIAHEFCLDGEFDIGARLQGMTPDPGEFSPSRWCVITEDSGDRVQFSADGRANPDLAGNFTVSFLPPETVRIINRESPPDIEFHPAAARAEARRHARIDPVELVREINAHPAWVTSAATDGRQIIRYPGAGHDIELKIRGGRLMELHTRADMPLRGSVPVVWRWDWPARGEPGLTLSVDGDTVFRGTAERRQIDTASARVIWQASGDVPPQAVPGDAWPARMAMRLDTLADDVYMVRGVRTGFHHLVVDTAAGLVVADAPAGWVELHQIPPADLVPGLGISGLSEQFIEFLRKALPGRPIRAVALTHAHDDHAGGARAFSAVGADVYAPAAVSGFLTNALNRESMPADGLSATKRRLLVRPVSGRTLLGDVGNPVELINIGAGPHASAAIGVYVSRSGFFFQSDLHVPTTDEPEPREVRAATECWFAAWAVRHLPPDTIVIGSHGNAKTPVSLLDQYLESDLCNEQTTDPATAP